jgi:hypothetical protein
MMYCTIENILVSEWSYFCVFGKEKIPTLNPPSWHIPIILPLHIPFISHYNTFTYLDMTWWSTHDDIWYVVMFNTPNTMLHNHVSYHIGINYINTLYMYYIPYNMYKLWCYMHNMCWIHHTGVDVLISINSHMRIKITIKIKIIMFLIRHPWFWSIKITYGVSYMTLEEIRRNFPLPQKPSHQLEVIHII